MKVDDALTQLEFLQKRRARLSRVINNAVNLCSIMHDQSLRNCTYRERTLGKGRIRNSLDFVVEAR